MRPTVARAHPHPERDARAPCGARTHTDHTLEPVSVGRVVLDKLARFKSNPCCERGCRCGWLGVGAAEGPVGRAEGWLSDCFAFLARAEHLRCKILNPGASAISPTSMGGSRIEEETEDGGRGDRRARKGAGEATPRRGRTRRGGSAARTQQVYI